MHTAYVGSICSPNPGKGFYGYYLHNRNGDKIASRSGVASSYTTLNAAEYMAVAILLEEAVSLKIPILQVYSSNKLIVGQLSGQKKVGAQELSKLQKKVLSLLPSFRFINFEYTPADQNKGLKLARQIIGKPRSRRERAEEFLQNTFIKIDSNNYIYIKGDNRYRINTQGPSCTCPDQQNRGGLCKHLMAVHILQEKYPEII
ncbi:MAG: hypothetical protein AVO34_06815 [Firmicutes bacterium ML8_F2]|nr:MAG: hypothetical protein AVO34_06815 [Firmicutes bacterium ML8_F2]